MALASIKFSNDEFTDKTFIYADVMMCMFYMLYVSPTTETEQSVVLDSRRSTESHINKICHQDPPSAVSKTSPDSDLHSRVSETLFHVTLRLDDWYGVLSRVLSPPSLDSPSNTFTGFSVHLQTLLPHLATAQFHSTGPPPWTRPVVEPIVFGLGSPPCHPHQHQVNLCGGSPCTTSSRRLFFGSCICFCPLSAYLFNCKASLGFLKAAT